MTNTSKNIPGVFLYRGIGLILLALVAGCASQRPQNSYQLDNGGRPLKNAQGVCVQIGPLTSADLKSACYQLAQTELNQHVEPLPLDEFGYLFPPLKPEPKLAPTAISTPAPVAITAPKSLPISEPAVPLVSPVPVAVTPQYVTKTVRFSTQMPFRLNRAYLSHKNRKALTAFVNSLEQYRGIVSIRITGHTDKSGPAHFNKLLSVRRAESAQQWLLALGVDPRTVRLRGVGSSEPRPHAVRAADNRYVDIEVVVRVPPQ
ncbi:MAG: OmpA family protein [Gammaproteobacteria bacterium]